MNARQMVRKAISDALADAEDLAGVVVVTGREPANKREWVWIRSVKGTREYKVLGPKPVPNEEDIEVLLRVVAIRDKEDVAEERSSALADAVEAALRAVEVGKPILMPLLVKRVEDEPLAFDTKAGHHHVMTISTKARI